MITKMITKDDDKGDDKKLKGHSKNEFKIFKIESRTLQDSRGKLKNTSRFKRKVEFKNQESRIKIKIQDSREELIKISIKKFFQKLSSTWIFLKTCLPKSFLLSGNRLPVSKMVFKKFSTKFTMFQLISKSCNRLQCFGNRLPVCLNVEIQIQK